MKALLDLFPEADHYDLLAATSKVLVPAHPEAERAGAAPLLQLQAALLGAFCGSKAWKDPAKTSNAIQAVQLLTASPEIRAATINALYRNVYGNDYTPLHLVTSFDRMPLMLVLIELGADVT